MHPKYGRIVRMMMRDGIHQIWALPPLFGEGVCYNDHTHHQVQQIAVMVCSHTRCDIGLYYISSNNALNPPPSSYSRPLRLRACEGYCPSIVFFMCRLPDSYPIWHPQSPENALFVVFFCYILRKDPKNTRGVTMHQWSTQPWIAPLETKGSRFTVTIVLGEQ